MNKLEFSKLNKKEDMILAFNQLKDDYRQLFAINDDLQSKIDKAIEYYETHQQECVIGRNKEDKLIKDYYLPAQCSKKLYEFLKEDK